MRLNRKTLTVRFIESVAIPSAEKREAKIFDTEQVGLGLRVYSTGEKTFFVQYRTKTDRRVRRMRIERCDRVSLEEARTRAREILVRVGRGEDPVAEQRSRRGAPTVSDLMAAYLEKHSRVSKKPRSIVEDETLSEKHVIPALGAKKAGEVSGGDIDALKRRMSATPARFNAARALLSHAFGLAIKGEHGPLGSGWGVTSNPCAHIAKHRPSKRGRVLTPDEWTRLAQALCEAKERPPIIAAIRLLAVTGARRNEILTARREWVDLEGACLRLPDSKTGPKTIALPTVALEIIRESYRADAFSKWLIPGLLPGSCATDIEHPWQRIRKAAGLDTMRLHDLRHSFLSTGGNLGIAAPLLQRAAGHADGSTTERYLHLGQDPVLAAAEGIAGAIAARMAGAR